MNSESEPIRKRKYRIRHQVTGEVRGPLEAETPTSAERPAPDCDRVARERYGKTREELIREAAHGLAARRGFRGGDPIADWLAAEAEIDARLDPSVDR